MMKSGKRQVCITREVVQVSKLESLSTVLETALEKVGEKWPSLVESPGSQPNVSGTFFRALDRDCALLSALHITLKAQDKLAFLFMSFFSSCHGQSSQNSFRNKM